MAALLVIVGVLGLTVALIAASIISKRKKEQQRTEAMRSVAEKFDWDFEPSVRPNTISGIELFALFDLGYEKAVRNLMYGEVDGIPATVFDYNYTMGVKNPRVYFQTVVLLERHDRTFPFFSLRPEDMFDKMFSAFGYQDIDFGNRPEFSRQYILRGVDETAIRHLFNDDVLSFYESNPGVSTDGGDNHLFVYRHHQLLAPEQVEGLIDLACEVADLMSQPRAGLIAQAGI